MSKSLAEVKRIERQAQTIPNLRDRKGFGLKKNGDCKNGYHQLRDGRVIYLKDLEPKQEKPKENTQTSTEGTQNQGAPDEEE